MKCLTLASLLVLAGCYSTGGLQGDPHADASTVPDTGIDVGHEAFDYGYDWGDLDGEDSWDVDAWDILETWDPWTDPGVSCEPPGDVGARMLVDDGDTTSVDLEDLCEVTLVDSEIPPSRSWIHLECSGSEHIVEIEPTPPLWLEMRSGMEVTFRYVVTPNPASPTQPNRWMTIKSPEGRLLVAGTEASSISPPGADAYDWYHPVGMGLGDPGCLSEVTDCYEKYRLELQFGVDGTSHHDTGIWDHGQGWVGIGDPYLIRLEDALEYRNIRCPGYPEHWYRLLVVQDR
jgi:hypothetical protein